MDDAVTILTPDDFFVDANKIVFRVMLELWNNGKPIDLLLIKSALETQNLLESVGGVLGLSEILDGGSRITNAEYYAQQIAETARLRRCIQAASSMIDKAYIGELSSTEIIEELDLELLKIVQRQQSKIHHAKDVVSEVFEKAKQALKTGKTGIDTGFSAIDYYLTGMEGGQYIIIAGRPSTGKTTLGMNIVENVTRQGIPSLVFSVEMSALGIGRRLMAKNSLIDSKKIKLGSLDESDWNNFYDAMSNVSKLPLYISDIGGLSTVQMRSIARQAYKKHKIGLIMIDYIQLMRSAKRNDVRNVEVTEISQAIKALAKELNVPVLVLSQLSRASEKRGHGMKPMLSDLRDSGALEQDADAVIFTHRPDKVGQKTVVWGDAEMDSEGICELIIAKSRDGETGTRLMRFEGEHNKFYEIDISPQRETHYEYDDYAGML